MSQYRPQRNAANTSRLTQPLQESSLQDDDFQQAKSPQFHQESNQTTVPKSAKVPDSDKKINQFDSSDQALKSKVNDLQKQVDDWRGRYLQAQSDNQTLVDELREEIDQYLNENNDLKEQIAQMEIEIQNLNQLTQNLQKENYEWENGFNKLEEDYNNEIKKNQESEKSLNELQQLNEENENLHNELLEKTKQFSDCKEQLQNLQIDLNQMHQDNEYNQQLLAQKDREIFELSQGVERNKELQRKQQDFSNKQEQLTKEVQRQLQLLKQQQKEISELTNEKQQLEEELIENKSNPEYLTKINLLGQEVERLNNTLALKSREINDYKTQITRMQKEIQNLRMNEFKLQDLNLTLDDLINQHHKLKDDNQILKQQISQKQIKINGELDKKMQQQQNECEKLQQQVNQSKKESDYLREQLNNLSQLEDNNRLLKQHNEKFQIQMKQLENDRQTLMQEYQLLSNSYNTQKFNYQQLIQEQQEYNDSGIQLKSDNIKLQQQLKETIEKAYLNRNLKDVNEQLQKELNLANRQLPVMKQTILKLQTELEECQNHFQIESQVITQQDQKLLDKMQKYEIRFPQLVEEIERLNRILTERNEEMLILKKAQYQQESTIEKMNAYEAEIERLRQTILLKQQTIDTIQQQKENPGVQDLVYKLQDENRRLTNLVSVRNNEIAELKFKIQDYESRNKLLSDSNSGKYEMQNMMLNQEIDSLNQKLLDAKNEISLLKITKNDKFNEERGKILTQELDKQMKINKENDKELLSLRTKYAEAVDAERKLLDCKCLLVLLYNEIERLNQNSDNLLF